MFEHCPFVYIVDVASRGWCWYPCQTLRVVTCRAPVSGMFRRTRALRRRKNTTLTHRSGAHRSDFAALIKSIIPIYGEKFNLLVVIYPV